MKMIRTWFAPSAVTTVVSLFAAGHASAAVIAHDAFATGGSGYTIGEIDNQNPTVTGFTGPWSLANTKNGGTISGTGLSYTGVSSSGGMYSALNARWYRKLATPFDNTTSGTYWMSYLYQSTEANGGSWQAFETYRDEAGVGTDAARGFHIANGAEGWSGGGVGTGQFTIGANSSYLLGAADTAVNLFLIRMDFVAGGNDTFTVWRNPTLGSQPTSGGVSYTGNLSFSYVGLYNDNGSGEARLDELRIGTTFADAIPEASSSLMFLCAAGLGLMRRKVRN